MNDTPDIFDTQVFASERAKFRKLAVKFGLAIIMLVLNNQFSAYLFVIIAALFSGGAETELYNDTGYKRVFCIPVPDNYSCIYVQG